MRVIIFGASGMIGSGALMECLDDPRIESVLVVGRTSTGFRHEKLEEILHTDFFDYAAIEARFTGRDACFFGLGVSSVGKDEATYTRLTHDLTLAAANAVLAASPSLVFCYISAQGADSSEQGRTMWGRVRGRTENDLARLPFKAVYSFRPGLVRPMLGVRSKTFVYQIVYDLIGPLMPLLLRAFPRYVTTTVNLARALIRAAESGYAKPVLENADINKLGA